MKLFRSPLFCIMFAADAVAGYLATLLFRPQPLTAAAPTGPSATGPERVKRPPPRAGFTLIELGWVSVGLTVVLVGVLSEMQEQRHRDNYRTAVARTKEIAIAVFEFYDENRNFPANAVALRDYLDTPWRDQFIAGLPIAGSIHALNKQDETTVVLSTHSADYLLVTRELTMTIDRKAVSAYRGSGNFPTIFVEENQDAKQQNELVRENIRDNAIETLICLSDNQLNEEEALELFDEILIDEKAYRAAGTFLDQNQDNKITADEIFNSDWSALLGYAPCMQAFTDHAHVALHLQDGPTYAVNRTEPRTFHHDRLAEMNRQLEDIRLAEGDQPYLVNLEMPLYEAGANLRTAEPYASLQDINLFQRKLSVTKFENDQLASDLATTASRFQETLAARLADAPKPFILYDLPQLYVGMEDDPFPTIAAALDYAQETGIPAVEIIVAPGLYGDPLQITRHTRIIGRKSNGFIPQIAGALVNEGPYTVEVRDVMFLDVDDVPGMITVADHDAQVFLDNVLFNNPKGYAVHQTGGEFRGNNLELIGGEAVSAELGMALQFYDGARVELRKVTMWQNHGGGILLSGFGTEANVSQLEITQTALNRYALEDDLLAAAERDDEEELTFSPNLPNGAIEVRDRAYLEGDFLKITDNEVEGFKVLNWAVANVRDSEIRRTYGLQYLPESDDLYRVDVSGANVVARFGAELQLTHFTLSHSDCGLATSDNAKVVLRGTEDNPSFITHHKIGICYGTNAILVSNLDNVLLESNEAHVRVSELPVPEPAQP